MTSIPQEMENNTFLNSSFSKNFTSNIAAGFVISDYEIGLQAAVLILILIVASVGNGFVGFCVFTHKNLQVPTNYFLVSLATADFLFAMLALPFRIYDVLEKYKWELGLAACRFWVWLDLLFCSASIASLAAISVDRYLKISSPLTYNSRMTRNRVRITLALLWIYSAILASLLLVEWSPDPKNFARGTIVENGLCRSDDTIFLTIISVLGFFAPLMIMLLMYFFVFKVAVIQATRVARQQQSLVRGLSKKSRKRRTKSSIALLEVKATKTLIILLSVFCICWCPYFIISLISLHKIKLLYHLPDWCTKVLKILFVNFLPNVNAALDPIVYTTNNHQFRTVIRRMLRKQRERARGIVSSVYSEGLYSMSESRGRRSSSLRTKSTSAAKNSLTPLPLLSLKS